MKHNEFTYSSNRILRFFLILVISNWIFFSPLFNSNSDSNFFISSIVYEIPFSNSNTSSPKSNTDITTEWTLMVYLDGDSDLEYGTLDIFNELEAGLIPNQGVEIVVLLDRAPKYDSSNDDWRDARYYHIVADSDPFLIQSELCENLGEVNLGKPTTLRNFVVWAQTEFPAQHYALMLYSHGFGLQGVCIDYTSYSDLLTVDEVQQALTGLHVDLLSVDACAMGVFEMVYEWATFADYIVSSENMIMIEGLDYNTSIQTLCLSPSLFPWEFGEILARTALDYYEWDWDLCYSVINCSQILLLSNALSELALDLNEFLINDTNSTVSSLRRSLEYTIDEGKYYFVDIGSMISLFLTTFQNSININESLINLKNIYEETISFNYHHKFAPNATGLLLVFPCDDQAPSIFHNYYSSIKDDLANLDILNDTTYHWDDFLANYVPTAPIVLPQDYPVESISLGEIRSFEINESIPFHDFNFQVEVGHIYDIEVSVAFGDVGVVVLGESFAAIRPRGYFYSNAQNPEQTNYERIVYWLNPGIYTIALSCWSIFSSYGKTKGNILISLQDPSLQETNSLIDGTFPPLRTASMPILPIYSYYLFNLDEGFYNISINITPGISLYVNLWEGLHTKLIDEFLGERNMNYNYTYHSLNSQQILVEISAYEGSGSFILSIASKTNNHNIDLPFSGILIWMALGILLVHTNTYQKRYLSRFKKWSKF